MQPLTIAEASRRAEGIDFDRVVNPAPAWYSAAVMTPMGWPRTTTWLERSPVGLRRIGFMATSGSIPAASAWTPWARPISWPLGVTNELSAMFWALNGATFTPWRWSSRHRPVTT